LFNTGFDGLTVVLRGLWSVLGGLGRGMGSEGLPRWL
jgi:hypothetical protein